MNKEEKIKFNKKQIAMSIDSIIDSVDEFEQERQKAIILNYVNEILYDFELETKDI